MKQTVTYKDKSFEFEAEKMSLDTIITHEDAENILITTDELFNRFGIPYMLSSGTLLGAIRDHDFIKGDFDVDIQTTDEGKLFDNLQNLEDNGLRLIRVEPSGVYSFRLNERCYIDCYIIGPAKKFPWSMYCYKVHDCYLPKNLFTGVEYIDFVGKKIPVPKNPIKLIKWWYGKDWQIPAGKNSYYYHYDVWSHYIFVNPKDTMKQIFRKIIGNKNYLRLKAKYSKK